MFLKCKKAEPTQKGEHREDPAISAF